MKVINDNILNFKGYIAHQVNCESLYFAGLAKQIYIKHPYASPVLNRTHRVYGRVSIHNKIINMYSQYMRGKPKSRVMRTERLVMFESCLNKILLPYKSDIAFPYMIGCGIAGGNWPDYLNLLETFDKKFSYNVYLYRYTNEI